jgi:hypothetical protein
MDSGVRWRAAANLMRIRRQEIFDYYFIGEHAERHDDEVIASVPLL